MNKQEFLDTLNANLNGIAVEDKNEILFEGSISI